MPSHPYRKASGRDTKRALVKAIAASLQWFLIEQRGGDLADDMLALNDYMFEVQRFGNNELVVRAKGLDEYGEPDNMPAVQFEIKVTGGG